MLKNFSPQQWPSTFLHWQLWLCFSFSKVKPTGSRRNKKMPKVISRIKQRIYNAKKLSLQRFFFIWQVFNNFANLRYFCASKATFALHFTWKLFLLQRNGKIEERQRNFFLTNLNFSLFSISFLSLSFFNDSPLQIVIFINNYNSFIVTLQKMLFQALTHI